MKTAFQFHPASLGSKLFVAFVVGVQRPGGLLSILLWVMLPAQAQSTTFPAVSYFINMEITPPTEANTVKPYGLIYDLLKNNPIPSKWGISQSKGTDRVDFTSNSVKYKVGTFVMVAPFRTAAVNAKISSYGVTGTTTTSLLKEVTYTLTATPTCRLDTDNRYIAKTFFVKAEISQMLISLTSGVIFPKDRQLCRIHLSKRHQKIGGNDLQQGFSII